MECREEDREDLNSGGLAGEPSRQGFGAWGSHLVAPGSSRPPELQAELWPRKRSAEGGRVELTAAGFAQRNPGGQEDPCFIL